MSSVGFLYYYCTFIKIPVNDTHLKVLEYIHLPKICSYSTASEPALDLNGCIVFSLSPFFSFSVVINVKYFIISPSHSYLQASHTASTIWFLLFHRSRNAAILFLCCYGNKTQRLFSWRKHQWAWPETCKRVQGQQTELQRYDNLSKIILLPYL